MNERRGPSGGERFSPTAHVLQGMAGGQLSLAARLLALVLAHKVRLTVEGAYVVWRGRASLAALTGLSTRSISKARRELLEGGHFRHLVGVHKIFAANGIVYPVARGVMVLELIRDRAAFLKARTLERARSAHDIEQLTHAERLEVQKQYLRDQITDSDRRMRESEIRRAAESERRKALRGERTSP